MNKKQENTINDKKNRLKFHKLVISHALCSNGSLYICWKMVTINKDFLNKHSLDILMFIIENQIKKP